VHSVVLLSGGLDSTVSLAMAIRETTVVLCLTVDYGQRAAASEIAAAGAIACYYGLDHIVLPAPFFKDFSRSALLSRSVQLPSNVDLNDNSAVQDSALAVWVPNRNGFLINLAACYAEALGCDFVITGFNREEAATFPDNSSEFVQAVNAALRYSTRNGVRVRSYTQQLNKEEIVQLGMRLGVPFKLIWSCYESGQQMCGRCESCRRLARAKQKAGVKT